ncbi:MAG: relaxase/mobilization nuclease domain-containing protein, partial [Blastocatellia bacterium]
WVERNFPNSRALIAVHQNTDHTHAHINIQARNLDGRKIDLDARTYRNLDVDWARIYGR